MKTSIKKVPRNFRFQPEIDQKLRYSGNVLGKDETTIVEEALSLWYVGKLPDELKKRAEQLAEIQKEDGSIIWNAITNFLTFHSICLNNPSISHGSGNGNGVNALSGNATLHELGRDLESDRVTGKNAVKRNQSRRRDYVRNSTAFSQQGNGKSLPALCS